MGEVVSTPQDAREWPDHPSRQHRLTYRSRPRFWVVTTVILAAVAFGFVLGLLVAQSAHANASISAPADTSLSTSVARPG